MAENTADKEAQKLAKEAEKAEAKTKKERIKQSKPKKEGNAFSRAGSGIKKFWKDFTGTCKKVVWPSGKQVLKSSCVVLVSIIVVGAVIFGFDTGINALFEQGAKNAATEATTAATEATTAESGTSATDAETTAAAAENTTAAAESTTAE